MDCKVKNCCSEIEPPPTKEELAGLTLCEICGNYAMYVFKAETAISAFCEAHFPYKEEKIG